MTLIQWLFGPPIEKYETQITSIGARRMVLIRIPGTQDGETFHQSVLALKTCMLNNKHQGKILLKPD